jgi:hypothetical protein
MHAGGYVHPQVAAISHRNPLRIAHIGQSRGLFSFVLQCKRAQRLRIDAPVHRNVRHSWRQKYTPLRREFAVSDFGRGTRLLPDPYKELETAFSEDNNSGDGTVWVFTRSGGV